MQSWVEFYGMVDLTSKLWHRFGPPQQGQNEWRHRQTMCCTFLWSAGLWIVDNYHQKTFFSLEILLGTDIILYSFEGSFQWPFLGILVVKNCLNSIIRWLANVIILLFTLASFLGLNALVQLCCIHCARFDILSWLFVFFQKTKCKKAKKIQGECFTTSSKSTWSNSCSKPFN